MTEMTDLDAIPYVPCRDQWPRRTTAPHIWIVLHSIESGETDTTAENCANYFRDPRNANGTPRIASTQFVCDNNSTIRCARWENRVAGAVGANDEGWHIEQAGVAAQSREQWRDDYSVDLVFGQVAPLVAALAVRDDIPLQFVDAAGLRRGVRGVTTHAECYKAFGGDVRTDPGEHYPMEEMLEEARRIRDGHTRKDWFDMATKEELEEVVEAVVTRHMVAKDGRDRAYHDKSRMAIQEAIIDSRDDLGIFIDERTDEIAAAVEAERRDRSDLPARAGTETIEDLPALAGDQQRGTMP